MIKIIIILVICYRIMIQNGYGTKWFSIKQVTKIPELIAD